MLSLFRNTGSPPQVRGKLYSFIPVRRHNRITPAGAGKTRVLVYIHLVQRDHPRRCGENLSLFPPTPPIIGSPPQVRGKHQCIGCKRQADRITPAGAGKTANYKADSRPPNGSPPQVRGKQSFVALPLLLSRITPAGAGKTAPSFTSSISNSDHPRRCGENL